MLSLTSPRHISTLPISAGRNAQLAVVPLPCKWRVKSTFNPLAIGFSVFIRLIRFNSHRYSTRRLERKNSFSFPGFERLR
jgi:hypothetical protein